MTLKFTEVEIALAPTATMAISSNDPIFYAQKLLLKPDITVSSTYKDEIARNIQTPEHCSQEFR